MLQLTADGSHTVYNQQIDETYHSTHGALQESMHVFINAGFNQVPENEIVVFEMGFGTGLNALLTLLAAAKNEKQIRYVTIEKFPLAAEIVSQINYSAVLQLPDNKMFEKIHLAEWNKTERISPNFEILKINADFTEFRHSETYNLIYFDAFSPAHQPEIWTAQLLENLYDSCRRNAILTTYCAKGELRRNLQSVGFVVERIAGANGKREMLRARKL